MTKAVRTAAAARTLTVEDLLRSPSLELRLIAGEAGIGRTVAWAHVSELEDPTPWLLGSELIMTTGIAVPHPRLRQVAYLERLDNAGVSALALSAKLHVPPLHDAFIDAANERSFPILEVPLPVPFIAIAQAVAAAVLADIGQGLSAQLQVFGALRWLTAEGLGVAEMFSRLETLSGYALYLCDPDRRPLLPEVPAPPEELGALIPAEPDGPPAIAGGYVLPVPTPRGPAGFLLAQRREGVDAADIAVVHHIATVAALQVTIVRHEQETLRREGAETLAEVLGGVLDGPAARRRLARWGFDQDRSVQLAAIRAGTEPPLDELVDKRLASHGVPHLQLRQQDQSFVLMPDDDSAREAIADLPGVVAGLSRPFEAGAPPDLARREALWAAARAAEAGGGLMTYGADAAGRWLAEDASALRALIQSVLGAVLGYDRTHASSLVPTVRTWMERERRVDDAAHALGIHPNTLAYRLRRFEQLSGRNLLSTGDLAEVWLAIRASEQVGDL